MRLRWLVVPFVLGSLVSPGALHAQDSNILFPADSLERWLRSAPFETLNLMGSRGRDVDRAQRATLKFAEDRIMAVKWAAAVPGGEEFNNSPRYEVGAYEFQKMFLDPPDYVVPPTVLRAMPVASISGLDPDIEPTFEDTHSVVVVLQYWLFNVGVLEDVDKSRFRDDPDYAYHLANLNLLTHAARHNDANIGNYLQSHDSENPRMFAVDNGHTFGSEETNRGHEWREMRVDRVPAKTVERLRAISREDLERELGTVAEFAIEGGFLIRAEPSANLDPDAGVRVTDDRVQFGLTEREIDDLERRIERLIERVDSGQIETF